MKKNLLKTMLLLCALIVGGANSVWADTYEQLTSIANIDENAQYVLGIDGTGFHYDGTSTWGKTALPSAQTPYYYTLKVANDGTSFTAETTINSTKYYLQIPTSNTFSMATSAGTNTDIIIGTTQISGTNYAVTNKTTTGRHLRINGSSGLRSYAGTTGTMAFFYKVIPAFTLTATSNNENYGTVSVSGNVITGAPKSGYRVSTSTPYTITAGEANVSNVAQDGNVFTVTASGDCTIRINFESIPTYTVTFDAEGGSCGTENATESIGGGGVTLPTATTSVTGWEFIGWAESEVTNTNTMPELFASGSTYYPTSATTLHAVYTLSETSSTFVRVSSINQVDFAKSIVVVKNSDNYVLNHSKTASVAAPTESNNEITAPNNTIFTLSGNNTDGFVLTGAYGTLSQTTVSTSGSNGRALDWSGNNNQWVIESHNTANTFTLSNSENVALEYYSGWKTYYTANYSTNNNTPMKLYVPKSAYNSNPSEITTPTVAFGSTDPVTLYLDGTITNTNTAAVTGVSKTINYSSSNPSVATVTSAGVVTAVGIGSATITASVDAELGVSASASDTYTVTVKSGTTLAGIKAMATSSTVVDFTADLANDLVITYVNGSHAYLQNGDVAVYASCANGDWAAGKKFTGSISGKVKKLNNEYQITAIDQTPAAGGVVPDAIEVAITDLTTENYATYEGRKIAINGATISTAMTSSQNSGGKITTDGTNTLNIYAREKGITLTKDEKGNFVGYIGRYNDGIRYYMYAQSQFTKTHNVPENQVMSFTNSSYNYDEETAGVTSFAGQEVTKTTVKGTVTYSIKDGSDDIITSLNPSTGAVVLNGACGTATIVATAAYAEVDEGDGYLTPYKALSKEYSVTVRPRYTVTFSENGVETASRQASYGASVAVPSPSDISGFKFVGWSTSPVYLTDDAPSMASLSSTITPEADATYYAVYAVQEVGDDENVELYKNEGSAGTDATSGITASGNINTNSSNGNPGNSFGLTSQANKTATFTGINISTAKSASLKFDYKLAKSGSNYSSLTVTQYDSEDNVLGSATEITGSDQTYHTSGNIALNSACVKITIVCSPAASTYNTFVDNVIINVTRPSITYSDYCTSLPVDVTIPASKFLSFCYDQKLDFSTTDVKAYKATVSGNKVVLEQVDQVPANTGVILYGNAGNYAVPVTASAAAVSDNEMVGVTERTAIPWTSDDKYNYILQSGEFNKANGGYLKANRAYLHTSYDVTAAGARELEIVFFEDEAAGITTTKFTNDMNDTKAIYNISGQRVAQPTKGLYIINGKKVFVK